MQAAGEPSNTANAHIVNVNRKILYFVLQLYLTYFPSGNSSSKSNLFSYIIKLNGLLNILLLITFTYTLLQALISHQSCGYDPTFSCRGYCFQYKHLGPFNLSGSTKQTFGSYHSVLAKDILPNARN